MRSRVFAAFLFLSAAAGTGAEMLERILGVVDERPVFLSDVRAVEAMDQISRKDALERVIDEILLFREASRLPQVATAPDPPGPDLGLGGAAARRRVVERRAAIRRYAAFRFRPQVRIEEEAVRRAYAERWKAEANPPTFESAASGLREELTTQAVAVRVEDWVKDLRAAARIRYNPID
jgi:hypothetical protein